MKPSDVTAADASGDARRLLARKLQACKEVIRVDRDSILFVTPSGQPRTAWLHRPNGARVEMRVVPGFQADPPEGWPGAETSTTIGEP